MTFLPKHFRYLNSSLHLEGVPLDRVARKFGTPVYAYSKAALLEPFLRLKNALAGTDHVICFAMKANSNHTILKLFSGVGAGFDVVSGGELFRARKAGANPSRVVFSGVGKTTKEVQEALSWGKEGILAFNVESAEELELLNAVGTRLRRKARVSVRLNPDVDPKTHPYISTGLKKNKFGLHRAEAIRLARRSQQLPWIHFSGASVHIGSQLLSLRPLREAYAHLSDFAEELILGLGIPLQHLDLGGGVGIQYSDESPPEIEDYGALIKETFGPRSPFSRRTGRAPRIILEPGRLIAGNAGVLITEVLFRKQGVARNFLIVDAAMNDLIRPALYGSHHGIAPLRDPAKERLARFDVVGPVCESSDVFQRGAPLPNSMHSGDRVALLSAGAYGFSMASQYNSRPRPAEVLVSGKTVRSIRSRESYEDLIRRET